MSNWVLIGCCAVLSLVMKSVGPLLVGAREELPPWALRVTILLAPAVLAGMVVTQTFARAGGPDLDAVALGVAGAAIVVWRRGSALVAVVVAVLVTAGARALT